MNRRKIIYRLMSLLMVLALLVACGGTAPEPTPEPEPEPTEAVEEEATAEPEPEPTDEPEPTEEPEPEPTDEPEPTEEPTEEAASDASADGTVLTLWYHGGGNETERELLMNIINDFNDSNGEYVVEMEDFPQESYNESIVAAALAGDLPDIIDVDGPVMPNWAWAEYMSPLSLSDGAFDGFLPGTIGEWDGEIYSVGLWDAAIAIYARKSVLEENDIRIPTLDEPWTFEEFDAALETLQATGEYEHAFDPGMAWTGEWYPYAFSPLMQSFGGDIIDRSTYMTAEGALNGDEAIAFGEWWQSLFERDLAPGTSQDGADRETGFLDGKYALQWNGNWAALPALEAFGDDMLFLPAPDFGNGNRIGAASWQFGVSANSQNEEGANAFIEFAIQDEYLAAFSDGIGLIPSTLSAAALTENYAPGGSLEVFFELSNQQGTLRPPTPAYLSAALTFEKALADIANGADVIDALDAAADEINADIEANDGYGFDGSEVGANIKNDAIAAGTVSTAPIEEDDTPNEPQVEKEESETTLSMWYHGGGNYVERDIIIQVIDDFNDSQSDYFVEFQDFPQESYNESIVAAALAGDLPDIIDVDGPVMPNWAWAEYMSPLQLSEGVLDGFLPGTIGQWDGEVYSVGLWDAAIAIYARKSVLEENDIRIPTLDEPWTFEEFDAALETLQATGEYEYAFDPGMAWTGEWYPYAFSPLMQSFGGDIIDRSTYVTAEGAINGDEAIAFGEWWQSLFERDLAPGTSQDGADRDTGFLDGKYALQWNGNWAALPALEAFGDDMLFLPAPDFGNGNRIGAASWQFGVSANSESQEGANAFIEFAIQDKYLAAFSDGIGLIPATPSSAGLTENYAPGGPLEVFFELSNQQGTLRPPTPAYLSAALTFEKALADIANGADVIDALDAAADEINADIEANGGYGFDGSEVGPNIQNDAIAAGTVSTAAIEEDDTPNEPQVEKEESETTLSMWYHGGGNYVERDIIIQVIDDFNDSQSDYFVEFQDFPQESYNESIVAAALAGDLPDIIDVDGPVMPNWAWAEYMSPLQLSDGVLDGFLPGTIGQWDGEVYSVGLWDAAIAIYARRSVLEENDIRIPTLDEPWTFEEFDAALETLQATGEYEYAFDPGMAWTGEWYPYAFSPLMQSFGGDIIDRSTYMTAEEAINGDEAIAFGEWWQSLFERDLAPGTSQDGADRDTGFLDGKYALQWNGNWAALPALEAFGNDMLFLPAPDFGNGNRIGAASWQFGVSANSESQEGANAFIEFAIQDKYLAAFSDGIGLIPATPSSAGLTENYAPGGPLEVFFELSNQQGTLRPPTPAYLSAALTFEKALADIANGADVIDALDAAADEINADIEANGGYGFDGSEVGPNIQNDAIAAGTVSTAAIEEDDTPNEPQVEKEESETTLSMWYHGGGNYVERDIIVQVIDDFNDSQSDYFVEYQDFPQESYNESIVAAALAGDLPDIIDVDGPVMPNWAWAEYMSPLQLSEGVLDGFLPGTIGQWDGEVYSVGLWDAAIAIYARRSVLEENDIRIPTLDEPWTFEEFDAALETLQATGEYDYAFDPGMAWTGEWYPYAFSPLLQSFGGDIIDRESYLSAEGVLNGDEAIAFGEWWQSLFERDLAPGTSQDGADRDTGFLDGKYALQWNGNWAALPALEAFGDDMLFLPAPDFGNGPKIGAASWQFGISAASENQEGANAFIEFAIQDKYLAAFSDGIGLIPSTPSAAALTENYAPGGPLEVFFELSNEQAIIRPPTPAYLSAALTFEKALADIANGADVINALDAAVDEINADIEANNGYGFGN